MREQEIEIRFNLMSVIYKPTLPITVLGSKKNVREVQLGESKGRVEGCELIIIIMFNIHRATNLISSQLINFATSSSSL